MLLFIGLLIVASYIVYLFLLLGLGHLIVASFAFALVLSSCSRVFCLSSCSRFFCSAFDHPKLTKEWHVFGDTGEKGRGREGRGGQHEPGTVQRPCLTGRMLNTRDVCTNYPL